MEYSQSIQSSRADSLLIDSLNSITLVDSSKISIDLNNIDSNTIIPVNAYKLGKISYDLQLSNLVVESLKIDTTKLRELNRIIIEESNTWKMIAYEKNTRLDNLNEQLNIKDDIIGDQNKIIKKQKMGTWITIGGVSVAIGTTAVLFFILR